LDYFNLFVKLLKLSILKRNLNHQYRNNYHVWDGHSLLTMLNFEYWILDFSNKFCKNNY